MTDSKRSGLLFKPAAEMGWIELLRECWYVLPRLRAAMDGLAEEAPARPSYETARYSETE